MSDYNGWSNYATWRIHLELTGDYADGEDGRYFCDMRQFDQADHIESWVDDMVSFNGEVEGLAMDYARAFLSDVNWYEIAKAVASDVDERFPVEEPEDCEDCGEPLDEDGDCLDETCENYYLTGGNAR